MSSETGSAYIKTGVALVVLYLSTRETVITVLPFDIYLAVIWFLSVIPLTYYLVSVRSIDSGALFKFSLLSLLLTLPLDFLRRYDMLESVLLWGVLSAIVYLVPYAVTYRRSLFKEAASLND